MTGLQARCPAKPRQTRSSSRVWAIGLIPMAVASAVGGFTGIAVARQMPQNVLRGVILCVGVVVTRPEYRGQGVATVLMIDAFDFARPTARESS